MKRWGIVLAALLLTAGCALADDSGFGLDNERAQAIYWEYSGAVIEDYAEVETAERSFAFILFKQEQRRMMKVYFASEFGWTDWFATAEGVPQGGRGRLETDGESVTISAADGNGGLRTITYAWDAAMPNEPKGTEESRKQFVGGFRLTAYDGARVDEDGVIHFAEGDAKVELLNDMRYLAYGNLPKTREEALENSDVPPGFSFFSPRWNTLFGQVVPLSANHSRKVYLGPGRDYPRAGNGKAAVGTNGWVQVFGQYDGWLLIQYHIDGNHYRIGWIEKSALPAGTKVGRLKISDFRETYQQEITADCVMTDDPLGSGAAIAHLKAGQKVWNHAFLGAEWEMITVEIDGQCYWGFVPTNCMSHG